MFTFMLLPAIPFGMVYLFYIDKFLAEQGLIFVSFSKQIFFLYKIQV